MDALTSDTDADNGSAHQHIVSIHYIVKCGTAMLYTSLILRTRTREHTSEALESA